MRKMLYTQLHWQLETAETSVSLSPVKPKGGEMVCTTGSLLAGLQLLCRTGVVSEHCPFLLLLAHSNACLFPGLGCI